MSQDNRARLKQWLESGEVRLQPLTFPQRELWEASPVPVADASNNICAIIQGRGLLTPQGSEAALQKVVDRQEVFRLSFLPGKDQPMQMIRNAGKPMLRFHELPGSQRQPEAIEELAKEVFSKPFDLVQGPLYRAEVFRRAADDHALVFAIHHAIADGWALGVFFQDLCAAYMDGIRGVHVGHRPVPLSYTEWGAAERAFWQPAELEQRATFWKSCLAGAGRLWSPLTGPDWASGQRERWVSLVPADLGRAVRELARRNGATLFSTLLAAFQIALSKWTGADDILVGTPVANRSKQAVRETMGYFSGIVPLRGQIIGSGRSPTVFGQCIAQPLIPSQTPCPLPNSLGLWAIRRRLGVIRSLKCVLPCRTIPLRMLRCRVCRFSSGSAPPAPPVSTSAARSTRKATGWRWHGFSGGICFPLMTF